jgi:hypothetical protein
MEIGSAVQQGPLVYVYDKQGSVLCVLAAGVKKQEGIT